MARRRLGRAKRRRIIDQAAVTGRFDQATLADLAARPPSQVEAWAAANQIEQQGPLQKYGATVRDAILATWRTHDWSEAELRDVRARVPMGEADRAWLDSMIDTREWVLRCREQEYWERRSENEARRAEQELVNGAARAPGGRFRAVPGRVTVRKLRAMWAARNDDAYVKAQHDCNGVLVNKTGRACGVDSRSLFQGPWERAAKYASDELKAWWHEHDGTSYARQSFAAFTGDKEAAYRDKKGLQQAW